MWAFRFKWWVNLNAEMVLQSLAFYDKRGWLLRCCDAVKVWQRVLLTQHRMQSLLLDRVLGIAC